MQRFWRTTAGLVTVVALAFALGILAIGAVAYEVTHEAFEQQLDHRIAAETTGLLTEAGTGSLPALAAAIGRREAARSTASLDYLLANDHGEILAGAIDTQIPSREGFEELLAYRHRSSGREGIAQALITRVHGGVLVVAADRSDLDAIDRTLLRLFAGSMAASLVLGLLAAGLVGWVIRRRLSRIDTTAQAIIAGDLARRIPLDGSDSEFDRLSGTLNHMLDRIENLMENLMQVSSDVAHDLRTPLTRLCSSLEMAEVAGDASVRLSLIENARRQATDLLEIFASLLRIAEVEGLSEKIPRQEIDVSLLLEQMVETYGPDFEDSGRFLQHGIAQGLVMSGDRRLLSQALANLLDNTLRHTPMGTVAKLQASAHDGEIILSMSDDGPGVTEADRSQLFRRFARAERSRSTEGHGLGLSMVKAIMLAHGGTVQILGGVTGFEVELRLPTVNFAGADDK
ncbi:MAG: HAMP domain-containing protein [Novosphingobium sp.]|nr:HAMP domain-containing protein [Novosphingobium sp.]